MIPVQTSVFRNLLPDKLPHPSSEAHFVLQNTAFRCHPLTSKNAFRARRPSKSENGRCENKAFVRDFLQIVKNWKLKPWDLFALRLLCCETSRLWDLFAVGSLCCETSLLWDLFAVRSLCCEISLIVGDCDSSGCDSGDCNGGDCASGACDSGDCDSGGCDSGDCHGGAGDSGGCDSSDWYFWEPVARKLHPQASFDWTIV